MRSSLPSLRVLLLPTLLLAACTGLACAPQQIFVDKPCPPVEYPVVSAPLPSVSTNDAAARTLDVRLTPTRDDSRKVVAIDVAMRFSVPPVDFGDTDPVVLHLGPHPAGAAIGDRVEDLSARDSEGSLGLRRSADGALGKPASAQWRSERRARGPVTVNYRLHLLSPDAGPDEVIASAGGVLGLGRALFLLPATTESHTIRIRWDVQNLGAGARGFSTFGTEQAEIEGPPSTLAGAMWAAGSLEAMTIISTSANAPSDVRFRWMTLGKSPFDVFDAGTWANRVWLAARTTAAENPPSQFDVVVRATEKSGKRFDVVVLGQAAMATVDGESTLGWPEKLSLTRAFIRGARGSNVMNARWFDEGFVTYDALETLRHAGLVHPSDIGAELTRRAERYFASPWFRTAIGTLDAQKDEASIQHAEDRGMLYAAELDGKIRAHSAGKRTLRDLLRMLAKPAPQNIVDAASPGETRSMTFNEALEEELGGAAVSRFVAVIEAASAPVDVADDAFGPCFKKVKKKIQREEGESKQRTAVDGFTFVLVPKLPPDCGSLSGPPLSTRGH